ncbi:uncharacterized protein si:dkey-242h9.3 isoform X1 [Triplophysa dalaica]|uniref:uncharacterized protein si:dkey-242h9.3 isoform X1 n=1 Tax=Triplophysa dalaica TaxID=1582913 RepID=UPI0024DFF594|nr:uncharacterized protein si:dkey-242h9.3 isoform X1 [Triplophysa dalaica]
MDHRSLRKRAVKRVNSLLASFDNEMQASGSKELQSTESAENVTINVFNKQEDSVEDQQHISDSEDDSQNYDIESVHIPLTESLCDWAVNFRVSLVALTALLAILRVHHPSLPKDARTLLHTTTSYSIQAVAGGTYHYISILKAFAKSMEHVWCHIPNRHEFKLQLHVDGLPLFKSSPVQFWPILGLLQGVVKKPVLIALFCGNSKPKCLGEYLKDLVSELKALSQGFVFKGKQCCLKVTSVICDAPARAFIKGTKTHTGYSGCDKCVQSGVYVKHRMTFPEASSPLRTDLSFKMMCDEDHHVTKSPLVDADIGMVSCFPHDYMHLVCLGVVRRLLDLWIASGPLLCRLSSRQMEIISNELVSLRSFIPMDFARKPRALSERLRWKATELRQFLLYTGPVVLQNVLSPAVYNNFMLLSVPIFLLASPSLSAHLNDLAHTLLVSFVTHFGELYGPEFVTYNVHGLTHLSEDVRRHGNLDLISGFPFENYLGKMKKMIRTPHHPLAQVIRRISEMDSCTENDEVSHGKMKLQKEHYSGPVPPSIMGTPVLQYQQLVMEGTKINVSSEGDRCVKIGGCIALIDNILQSQDKIYIVYREYELMEPFFDYPLNSLQLGIYLVGQISSCLKTIQLFEHVEKYVRLPKQDKFVAVPLLHLCQ